MKKLSLLLFATFISLMSWALTNEDTQGLTYTLNPYAYDLSSTWNPFEKKLIVRFRLNTPPNMTATYNGDSYKCGTTTYSEPRGIQIYAVDSQGNEYRIGGPSGEDIKTAFQSTDDQYGYFRAEIDLSSGKCTHNIQQIPKGVPLTWKVRVKDRHQGSTTYQMLRNTGQSFDKLPYKVTGMATSNCPYAPNFGKTFVANTDNGSSLNGNATYGWLYNALCDPTWMVPKDGGGETNATRTPALLEYTAQLKYKARHRKNYHDGNKSWFSSNEFEPHRVRVSEDGRIFVSSYLPTTGWAVAEMIGGDSVITIVKCDQAVNEDKTENDYVKKHSRFNRRAIDFDVKGSGDDLKILVAWVTPKGTLKNQKYWYAKVECYEYQLGKAEKAGVPLPLPQVVGQANNALPDYIQKVAEYNDFNSDDGNRHGLIFQGFAGPATNIDGKTWSSGEKYYNSGTTYTAGKYGFIGVAYGKGDDNPIWMKVDFGINKNKTEDNVYHEFNARILYFNNESTSPQRDYKIPEGYSSSGYYGGHAIAVTEDYLITADGRTRNYPTEHDKHLLVYSLKDCSYVDNDGTTKTINGLLQYPSGELPARMWATRITNETNANAAWISGLSVDYANNVYVTISTPQSTGYNSVTLNPINKVYILSLPATGYTDTPAPKGYEFMLPKDDAPVANIYPSKMRYVPAITSDSYWFSFYANTKPKYAEIRFYRTKDAMQKSMANVNADNYEGDIESSKTDELYCAYRIPEEKLKQGKIEVKLGMLGANIDAQKYITNACLPNPEVGELYWSVYVETDRSSAFAPIYRQSNEGKDVHHTLHATINNYPETDQFGTIYATSEDKRNGTSISLMQYEISDNVNKTGEQYHFMNTTRYTQTGKYIYPTSQHNTSPRRMEVDANGNVYMAHEGYIDDTKVYQEVAQFTNGGIYIWNPNDPTVDENIKLTLFSDNGIGTATAVVFNPQKDRLFATNTYNEFKLHGGYYDKKNQGDPTQYKNGDGTQAAVGGDYSWNGFVEYIKGNYPNPWTWTTHLTNASGWTAKKWAMYQGDASGNFSLVATDKGLWMCQHREHSVDIKVRIRQPLADTPESYVLRFIPYNSQQNPGWEVKTWRSCTTRGMDAGGVDKTGYDENGNPIWSKQSLNSQYSNSPLQATPGAGIAWKKINGDDYLFIVNQDGNIVREKLEWIKSNDCQQDEPRFYVAYDNDLTKRHENLAYIITSDSVKGVLTVTHGGNSGYWKTSAITSMCFDYAGNLITTTGVSYHTKDHFYVGNEYRPSDAFRTQLDAQNIIVYTMPYDRVNAREIQAPNSCVRISERITYKDDKAKLDDAIERCNGSEDPYIDIYRPMPSTSYSTICLPFDVDIATLADDHPYKTSDIREFANIAIKSIGGENILELQFSNISENQNYPNILKAHTPYIIQPSNRIGGIVRLPKPAEWNMDEPHNSEMENITFKGVIPRQDVEVIYDQQGNPLNLILVAENRLAEMVHDKQEGEKYYGEILGFRGYFTLEHALQQGMQAIISKKDKTVTGLIDVNGQKVNIEKYLREGRVYIRMGDTLYTITGEKVK